MRDVMHQVAGVHISQGRVDCLRAGTCENLGRPPVTRLLDVMDPVSVRPKTTRAVGAGVHDEEIFVRNVAQLADSL